MRLGSLRNLEVGSSLLACCTPDCPSIEMQEMHRMNQSLSAPWLVTIWTRDIAPQQSARISHAHASTLSN